MKTLVRPQVKSTIAISGEQIYNKKSLVSNLNFKSSKNFIVIKTILFILSFLIFAIVPDSPEQLSDVCNKYNSQEACAVW